MSQIILILKKTHKNFIFKFNIDISSSCGVNGTGGIEDHSSDKECL